MYNNKFIRIYEDEPVPSFSYEDLLHLQQDKSLNPVERAEFKKMYEKIRFRIEHNNDAPGRFLIYVRPESGILAFTYGERFQLMNSNEVEIPYEEVAEIAFDASTPDQISQHYQDVLNEVKKTMHEWDADLYRFIFLQNIYTGRVKIWFD